MFLFIIHSLDIIRHLLYIRWSLTHIEKQKALEDLSFPSRSFTRMIRMWLLVFPQPSGLAQQYLVDCRNHTKNTLHLPLSVTGQDSCQSELQTYLFIYYIFWNMQTHTNMCTHMHFTHIGHWTSSIRHWRCDLKPILIQEIFS